MSKYPSHAHLLHIGSRPVLVAYDSDSSTLASFALAGGDVANAAPSLGAAAGARVFAVAGGGTTFHLHFN